MLSLDFLLFLMGMIIIIATICSVIKNKEDKERVHAFIKQLAEGNILKFTDGTIITYFSYTAISVNEDKKTITLTNTFDKEKVKTLVINFDEIIENNKYEIIQYHLESKEHYFFNYD